MAKRLSDKSRYRRLPGTKKSYVDLGKKSRPEISYYEFDKRTNKERLPSRERTARRRGYASAAQRAKAVRQARGRATFYPGPYATVQETKAAERYSRLRAFQRADKRQRDLARVYAIKEAGPGRPIDLAGAMRDPEFQRLAQRLRELELEEADHPDKFNDPFYDAGGEYARVLEDLGRRVPNADYRVYMSGDAGYPLAVVIALHQGTLIPSGPTL